MSSKESENSAALRVLNLRKTYKAATVRIFVLCFS